MMRDRTALNNQVGTRLEGGEGGQERHGGEGGQERHGGEGGQGGRVLISRRLQRGGLARPDPEAPSEW
jgi:hypothetical protein